MSEEEDGKTSDAPRRFRPEYFIRRLQAQGFIRWGRATWIHPKDIPAFIVKAKINRWRKRRAMMMAQLAETESTIHSNSE